MNDVRTYDIHTSIHSLCVKSIINCLIITFHSSTAPVTKDGRGPLAIACSNGKLNVAKYLVEELHCDPKGMYYIVAMKSQRIF